MKIKDYIKNNLRAIDHIFDQKTQPTLPILADLDISYFNLNYYSSKLDKQNMKGDMANLGKDARKAIHEVEKNRNGEKSSTK